MIIQPANRLENITEYYFSTKLREIRNLRSQGKDIINLGIGSPDLPPSDETIKQLVSYAIDPNNHAYQPYKGIPALREAFAEWYWGTFGVKLDPDEEVLPLMGSKEGIMHITMAFVNPGDEVLVPDPGYPTYAAVARIVGGEVKSYPLKEENQWFPNLDQLAQQDLSKVKIMWINYPHMPTGAMASDDLFRSLIDFAHKHRILLCHDNPYSLVLNPHPRSILGYERAMDVAIELNSLSKSHNMAGWRIGMVAGNQEYIQYILKVKSNMDSGMFMPLQQAATTALRHSFSWHHERNNIYDKRRTWVKAMLDELRCDYQDQQAGMFLWAKIPGHVPSSRHFSDSLLYQANVFLTPGCIFGQQGEGYIRISLCSPDHRLEEALNRISSFAGKNIETMSQPHNH